MPQSFSIGGVKIYSNNNTKLEILEKENGKNVIKYNGITIKFPDQENKKIHGDMVEPKINTFRDATEIWYCKDLEVYGSEQDDRINAYGNINSIYDIANGGSDFINIKRFSDQNCTEEEKNIQKLRLGIEDEVRHSYCEYGPEHNLLSIDTFVLTGTDEHKVKLKERIIETFNEEEIDEEEY